MQCCCAKPVDVSRNNTAFRLIRRISYISGKDIDRLTLTCPIHIATNLGWRSMVFDAGLFKPDLTPSQFMHNHAIPTREQIKTRQTLGQGVNFTMNFRKVVFLDLDGTLTDSGPGIINSFNFALDRLGLPPLPENPDGVVGPSLWESFPKYGVKSLIKSI